MPLRRATKPPPIVPLPTNDPLFSSVALLLPLRTDFNDRSINARALTSQGVTLSADTAKFGSQSAKFGSQTYLTFQNGEDLSLSSDFLIEVWVMQTSRPNEFAPLLESLNGQGYSFALQNGKINFNDRSTQYTGNATLILNQWHHIAVWKRNGILSFWLDGVPDFAAANNKNILASSKFRIGSNSWSDTPYFWFTGYLQDLRLTKAARSPILPTQPFPTNG